MTGRLLKHYLPLLAAVLTAMLLFYIYRGQRDFITFIAQSTAYISLVILAVTLLIGPANLVIVIKEVKPHLPAKVNEESGY